MIQGKGHFLISSRRGLGTSLLIIRLATIDPQSQKEHIDLIYTEYTTGKNVNRSSLSELNN